MCAELLWEHNARVVVDFTPGGGMLARTALMMSIKCILICHNSTHVKLLKKVLGKYVRDNMESGAVSALVPAEKEARLHEAKPARLARFGNIVTQRIGKSNQATMTPRWPQDGPTMALRSPHDGPKLAPR